MTDLSRDIAYVSFPNAGVFLPVRTPDDRRALREQLDALLQREGRVQVLLNGDRWVGCLSRHDCAACGLSFDCSYRNATRQDDVRCVDCALGIRHPHCTEAGT